jgi:hypothetical protein
MKMKNELDKITVLNAIDVRGAFAFVAVTTKDALKKSRVTKLPTPAHLVTITTVKASTVSLGNDYETAVNNRLLKEGKENNFEAQETYCTPVAENKLLYKHKAKDQYYLRIYQGLCASFKTVVRRFDANGLEISDTDWKAIEAEYFTLPSKSENQGLDNAIIVNNYKLENVKYLKRGDVFLDELTQEIVNVTKGA